MRTEASVSSPRLKMQPSSERPSLDARVARSVFSVVCAETSRVTDGALNSSGREI